MKTTVLNEETPRTWAVVLDEGEDVVEVLERFARERELTAAHFSAIGAFRRATLRYFDWETKEYQPIEVDEQVEVAAFSGNVARKADGEARVHVHAVLARRDGGALGGDLGEGIVRPTLEVVVTEQPGYLRRTHDARTGLALISG